MNALAAAAATLAVGVTLADIKSGLENIRPVAGRLQAKAGKNGLRIIDDTYNANPASVSAALRVLVAAGGKGQRWFVLGDMAELGRDAAQMHVEVGRDARSLGVDRLYTVGALARGATEAFGSGATHFDRQEDLIAALSRDIAAEAEQCPPIVMIKGSRSMRMEKVVAALAEVVSGQCGGASSAGVVHAYCRQAQSMGAGD